MCLVELDSASHECLGMVSMVLHVGHLMRTILGKCSSPFLNKTSNTCLFLENSNQSKAGIRCTAVVSGELPAEQSFSFKKSVDVDGHDAAKQLLVGMA